MSWCLIGSSAVLVLSALAITRGWSFWPQRRQVSARGIVRGCLILSIVLLAGLLLGLGLLVQSLAAFAAGPGGIVPLLLLA